MKSENNYLVWKQKKNIFAAVDRFNVVTFWNTITGELIYKKLLEGKDRIQDAQNYRCHTNSLRHDDPANLFDNIPHVIVSYKKYPKGKDDENDECFRMKLVKLKLEVTSETEYDASCETLCGLKL